jgi:translation initiation factor IF-2
MTTKLTHTLSERPPIVAVLGHVDHGKSTLLDYIRKANTVAKEAGGITQHVAAYEVTRERGGVQKRITFIDTPGHAAFKSIRARGANVADIAILVVAADDGVKAQTLEALESIREAKTPFIVAINKIDKPGASVERTQASLMEHGVYLEQLGGDIPWAPVSAKAGTGVDELLDLILLVAEILELKADPTSLGHGYVIEANRDQKRGIAATLIITQGTIKSGMAILAGQGIAPIRLMEDHTGKALKEATFSTPVRVIGFDVLPEAGAEFHTFKSKRDAEAVREEVKDANRLTRVPAAAAHAADGHFTLPVIIRADTTGSLEAIAHELGKLGDERMSISIVQSGIGAVSESDIKTATASAVPVEVIGFNVGVDSIAKTIADQHSLIPHTFNIIYQLTEHLDTLMKSTAPKQVIEEVLGRARLIRRFSSQKDQHVVGGAVLEGMLAKNGTVRVLRRQSPIGIAKIKGLQTNRQNVEKAEAPSEFGAMIEAPFELAEGDVLEHFVTTVK